MFLFGNIKCQRASKMMSHNQFIRILQKITEVIIFIY